MGKNGLVKNFVSDTVSLISLVKLKCKAHKSDLEKQDLIRSAVENMHL